MTYSESETVELKREINSDICKKIIAFANTGDGTIYIGVRDDGSVCGIGDPDEAMLRLANMVRDSIRPDLSMFVRYEVIEEGDAKVLAVTVEKGTARPYYLASKGLKPSGVYVRSGTSSAPSSEQMIRKMIKETDGDSFEDLRSLEQSLTFREAAKAFRAGNVEFGKTKMRNLGLVSPDGTFSNAGLLLSDQCPFRVMAAVFDGTDMSVFRDRKEFPGSVFRQLDETLVYLNFLNKTRSVIGKKFREEIADYPEEALRESVINAIVHRDYSYQSDTRVSVFADRIEILSFGTLPSGLTLKDLSLGASLARNRKLAAIFFRLKLMEAYGTGIPRILKSYEGFPRQPSIEIGDNTFRITLPNRNFRAATAGGASELGPEGAVLEMLRARGTVKRSDIDALLGTSTSRSVRLLRKMTQEGLIRRVGEGVGARYTRA